MEITTTLTHTKEELIQRLRNYITMLQMCVEKYNELQIPLERHELKEEIDSTEFLLISVTNDSIIDYEGAREIHDAMYVGFISYCIDTLKLTKEQFFYKLYE